MKEKKRQALCLMRQIGEKEKQIKQMKNEIFSLLDELTTLCGEEISFFYTASPFGLLQLKETVFSILEDTTKG